MLLWAVVGEEEQHLLNSYQWQIQDFLGMGAPIYYPAKLSRKLHENKVNWAGGGGAFKFAYVDPPLIILPKSLSIRNTLISLEN